MQDLLEKGTFLEGGVEILCFILRDTSIYMYVKRQEPIKMDILKINPSEIHEKLMKLDSENRSIVKNNHEP